MHRTPVGIDESYPGCDYTDEEREFLIAMDRFRRRRHRPFPSCREVLEVIRSLGYVRAASTGHTSDVARATSDS